MYHTVYLCTHSHTHTLTVGQSTLGALGETDKPALCDYTAQLLCNPMTQCSNWRSREREWVREKEVTLLNFTKIKLKYRKFYWSPLKSAPCILSLTLFLFFFTNITSLNYITALTLTLIGPATLIVTCQCHYYYYLCFSVIIHCFHNLVCNKPDL